MFSLCGSSAGMRRLSPLLRACTVGGTADCHPRSRRSEERLPALGTAAELGTGSAERTPPVPRPRRRWSVGDLRACGSPAGPAPPARPAPAPPRQEVISPASPPAPSWRWKHQERTWTGERGWSQRTAPILGFPEDILWNRMARMRAVPGGRVGHPLTRAAGTPSACMAPGSLASSRGPHAAPGSQPSLCGGCGPGRHRPAPQQAARPAAIGVSAAQGTLLGAVPAAPPTAAAPLRNANWGGAWVAFRWCRQALR